MISGELFAGVGGLGMAVDEVFGSSPAWFAEFDAAPSKVLAYRHPGVPNHGDVTKLTNPEKVQILAGGFPCQDVSLAGRRKGMKDGTRSGLWSEYARIIDEVRPDWVVIENVRGLLSADAAGDVEPCPLCVGDNPGHVLRALGAVLGDLAELGFDAEWTGIRASDIGAPHGRFRVFILAWPTANTRSDEPERRRGHGDMARTPRTGEADGEEWQRDGDAAVHRGAVAPVKLLSTPDTVPEAPNTGSNSHKAGDIVGLGNQIMSLHPTPIVSDGTGGPKDLDGARFAPQMREITQLLPTPGAYGGERGGSQHPDKRRAGNHSVSIQDVAEHLTDWGPYADAIARWEAVIGRPAPAPVRFDGKGGKPRLNPELTEWMMGWPAGHVTDPTIGLTRAEQLKACGNGVVPQQAAAALRELLSREGVPSL